MFFRKLKEKIKKQKVENEELCKRIKESNLEIIKQNEKLKLDNYKLIESVFGITCKNSEDFEKFIKRERVSVC